MELPELAEALTRLGCPNGKAMAMAAQLDRKARMDAARLGSGYSETLGRLLGLMAQGWAADASKKSGK